MATTENETTSDASTGYAEARIKRVTAENGIDYAYRDLGEGDVPLVLLQHFRGNLDNWDPALIDALAADRRVVCFDNVGVGAKGDRTVGHRLDGARRRTGRGASPTIHSSNASPRSICRSLSPNGDSDPMIVPRFFYLLAGLLPNARLTIYADSAHGFLFQHHSQFAVDVNAFLAEAD